MTRRSLAGWLGVGLLLLAGCGEDTTTPKGPPPGDASEVPKMLDLLTGENKGNVARVFAVRRLGELGPLASDAVPTLKQIRAVSPAEFQKMIDESLAKIEGTSPPAAGGEGS